jgi:hydrogenase maturation protein HypF
LALLAQPGGDVAARQPWRMAMAQLHRLQRIDQAPARFEQVAGGAAAVSVLTQMVEKGLNSPRSSSCGRLFDAACGLLGVVPVAAFEGEAPMALERMVTAPQVMEGGWTFDADGSLCLDPLMAALADMGRGRACSTLTDTVRQQGANVFHGTLAAALVAWLCHHAMEQENALPLVVPLGGGCFFNRVLRHAVVEGLRDHGFQPLLGGALSAGDPAVSAGQAWMVARQCAA